MLLRFLDCFTHATAFQNVHQLFSAIAALFALLIMFSSEIPLDTTRQALIRHHQFFRGRCSYVFLFPKRKTPPYGSVLCLICICMHPTIFRCPPTAFQCAIFLCKICPKFHPTCPNTPKSHEHLSWLFSMPMAARTCAENPVFQKRSAAGNRPPGHLSGSPACRAEWQSDG